MSNRQIDISTLKSFTTEPQIPKKQGNWRSIQNAKAFMFHLWNLKLKKCSFSTLEFEFINFFGTNDRRTSTRYIGRIEETVGSGGSVSVVRQNLQSGRVAQFHYFNKRRIPRQNGLMQILGFISILEKTVIIHHERMPYYSEQVSLESAYSLHELKEESEYSKDKMCVSSLLEEKNSQSILQGKECEKTVLEVVSLDNIDTITERKEEEVIDCTHTRKIGKIGENHKPLSAGEQAILNGRPSGEPDRSTPIRRAPSSE